MLDKKPSKSMFLTEVFIVVIATATLPASLAFVAFSPLPLIRFWFAAMAIMMALTLKANLKDFKGKARKNLVTDPIWTGKKVVYCPGNFDFKIECLTNSRGQKSYAALLQPEGKKGFTLTKDVFLISNDFDYGTDAIKNLFEVNPEAARAIRRRIITDAENLSHANKASEFRISQIKNGTDEIFKK